MRNPVATSLTILALAIVGAMASGPAHGEEADDKAVAKAASEFYGALNAMFSGDLAPMTEIWSHADDVTYMGPAGDFQVGWTRVLAAWQKQAEMKLGGEVRPDEMRFAVGRDLAVAHNFERGENVDADGNPQSVSIRATSTFRKENGKWKMIGHHTDRLPNFQ